jgi:hypothetical protein
MKKVIHRIQALGEKAAQLKHVVEGAPAVATGIRDAVAVTAGQLQQLRADVQAGVSGLRVEDEDRLLAALREVGTSTELLEEAGYALGGVDVELGLLRRIVVRLEKLEEVGLARLRAIHASSAGRFTVQALLNALIKAEEMAAKVDLPDLTYRQLIVDVGPAPTVRVCWRPDAVVVEEPVVTRPAAAAATVPPVLSATSSLLGKSSFFQPREAPHSESAPAVPAAAVVPPATPVPASTTLGPAAVPGLSLTTVEARSAPGDWKRGALDRFKRMPDLSKSRR